MRVEIHVRDLRMYVRFMLNIANGLIKHKKTRLIILSTHKKIEYFLPIAGEHCPLMFNYQSYTRCYISLIYGKTIDLNITFR